MNSKVCTKCGIEKEIFEYNWRNRIKGWRHSFCKTCHSHYRRAHYLAHKEKYITKARTWNRKQSEILRVYISNYLSKHPCVDCGVDDIRVLDFDHEKKKFMGICYMIRNCYSIAAIMREMRKCKVRCANCHRIKTFIRGKYWKVKMGL